MTRTPVLQRAATVGTIAGLLCAAALGAQTAPPPAARSALSPGDPVTMPLWANGAPGALGTGDDDTPTLTYYAPTGRGSGAALVIAPGGGYQHLALNHEGRQVANWANSLGLAAFVLKYRLGPRYHHPVELHDAQRAIRTVRARAAEFGVLPDRIGIMGFSAGGHLASTAGTHFDTGVAAALDPIDRVSSRPDFLVLAYPVITFTAPYAHQGSVTSLIGANPDPKLVEELSNELQVTKDTPPTFIFHTSADTTVPVENSVMFYAALHKAGVPAELHIFQSGPHGVGLAMDDAALGQWPALLATWLRERGLLRYPTPLPAPGAKPPSR